MAGPAVRSYLERLLQRAEEYCHGKFDDVTYFYRNKPKEYFSAVKKDNMVMRTYLKDNNGDPMSPINDKLLGVFFCVTLYDGNIPTISPFGDTRIQIPIAALFDHSTNLYFTDFYCMGLTTEVHYITLVITKKGSESDEFCKSCLPLLDPNNNKFLKRTTGDESVFKTVSQSKLYVEVFYTEDVDIKKLISQYEEERVFFTKTSVFGQGHSTPGGIPKCKCCPICNITKQPMQDEAGFDGKCEPGPSEGYCEDKEPLEDPSEDK